MYVLLCVLGSIATIVTMICGMECLTSELCVCITTCMSQMRDPLTLESLGVHVYIS